LEIREIRGKLGTEPLFFWRPDLKGNYEFWILNFELRDKNDS